jgi:hypothetical protein
MKNTIGLFILVIAFYSCKKKDDVRCENAQLTICNTTTNQSVIYGWNTNQIDDTLFPGECVVKDFGEVLISYDFQGNEDQKITSISNFYTLGATYSYEMESCSRVIAAPGGYMDIAHCYNGVFDSDKKEFDIDCGGPCIPCKSIKVPCEASLKEDEIDWQTGGDDDLNSASEFVTNSKMRISYRFYSGQELTVTIPVQSFPISDRKFTTGTTFFDAEIVYNDRFEDMYPEVGEAIYFVLAGEGTGKIEFCDLKFTGAFTSKIGSGSLSFRD